MNPQDERATMKMLLETFGRDRDNESMLDKMQKEITVIEAEMLMKGDTGGQKDHLRSR